MTNYISQITANNTTYPIGGEEFDGQWVYDTLILANSINVAVNRIITYDLSSYLPNNDYDYEVLFTGSIWCAGSSGSGCGVTLADGQLTSDDESKFIRLGRCNTRTASSHGVYYNGIIPVLYSNGRKITYQNKDSNNTATNFQLKAMAYRRIGDNNDYTTGGIHAINVNNITYQIGGNNFNGSPVAKYLHLINVSSMAANSSTECDLSDYLPDDNYNYEVLVTAYTVTAATSGRSSRLALKTSELTDGVFLTCAMTRSDSTELYRNAALIEIPTDRKLIVTNWSTATGAVSIHLTWYRRVGTND